MLKFVIRIRITHQPTARSIDGIRLDQFYAGQEVELGDTLADYLLATHGGGWYLAVFGGTWLAVAMAMHAANWHVRL